MKYLMLFTMLLSGYSTVYAQDGYILWSFETGDRLLSNPETGYDMVFFGSNDNYLYAVNPNTESEFWKFETGFNVQSAAVSYNDMIFFESGNNCYALDKYTGTEIWSFISSDPDGTEKIDPWDYHHAAPVINDTIVYFGCGNGMIYGFNLSNGILQFQYRAIDSASIRSTPVIENGILYFGDWNGRVYALDINLNDTIWTKKTYEEQPYSTFGMVNTELLIYDSLVVFGARNPEIQVLNKNTGEVIWDYTVPGGGWISGDPVVYNDTLFIGGSDCHKMFAFNVYSGELYWTYTFLYNNFSKPVICSDYIVFTTGDAYAYQGTNYGTGYLYALKRTDGSIHNFFQVGGNVFTTPAIRDGKIYVCSSDKHLYAVDSISFLDATTDITTIGYRSFFIHNVFPNPFKDTVVMEYSVEYKSDIFINIYSMDGSGFRTLFAGNQNKGVYNMIWDGRDARGQLVANGAYVIEVYSGSYKMSKIVVKQ